MKSISKEHIAIIQLKDALDLYFNQSYISAITLSAAAEEILAKLADQEAARKLGVKPSEKIKNNYADESAFLIANFLPHSSLDKMSEAEKEIFKTEIKEIFISNRNRVRNQLKHKNEWQHSVYFNNFKKIAEEHLSGAIINLKLYKGELPDNEELILRYCNEKGIS